MTDQPPEPPPPPRKRFGWLRRDGIDLGDAAVQFVAVLLGVLLALFINRWNNQRQQQAKAQAAAHRQQATVRTAMHAIHAELVANRNALHKNTLFLYSAATRMQQSPKNREDPAPRPCVNWDQWRGIGFLNLVDAAYQTAISTQALAHVPFKQAQLVARMYGYQHYYQHAFDSVNMRLLFAGKHTVSRCALYLETRGMLEQSLSARYDPLIGPDKKEWPHPPSNPLLH